MSEKSYNWHKIAATEAELQFGENKIALVECNGKKICIGQFEDSLFAFSNKCPHAGGLLSTGHIDLLGNVVCPLHRYKFSIKNGRNTSGEGYFLKHWPVEKREDGIYLAQDKGGLFSWM